MRLKQARGGFTLLELSIVIVIIALVAGMGLAAVTAGTGWIESTRRGSTNNKLNVIENALMAYRTTYGRLPCPADASLLATNANYGVEAANMGSCTGGTPAATFSDATHGVVEGAVPFKRLNLPESFMYDGWDRKFAYAVSQPVTGTQAMVGQSLTEMCGISVTDAGGVAGNRTGGAVYALVSFGADGHGGYIKSGSRLNGGSTNADELTNCHCNSSAVGTAYAASYVEKDISLDASDAFHPFSDYVRFKERWQMMTYDDMYQSGAPVCSPGFRADGMVAGNTYSTVAVGDVNGDGIPDLVIGNFDAWYVVFGTRTGFPNPLPLNSLNGSNGFKIWGYRHYGTNENSLALSVGDINGDGYADILLPNFSTSAGVRAVFVLFGHANPWPATIDNISTALNGTNGVELSKAGVNYGAANNYSGAFGIGDITGDGLADILFSDYTNHRYYVIFGQKCGGSSSGYAACSNPIDPTVQADGTHGFYLVDDGAGGYEGWPAFADVNGDGVKDLLFRSVPNQLNIIFGHAVSGGYWAGINGSNFSSMMDGTHGTLIQGAGEWSFAINVAVGDITDVNSNASPVLIIGEQYQENGYGSITLPATAYVIPFSGFAWGSASYLITTLVSGGKAYWITGDASVIGGFEVVAVADINGDGINDIILCCPDCNVDSPYGSCYVIYGKAGALSNLDLAVTPLNGSNGFRIDCSYAPDLDWCGAVLATADMNGDGISDLVINSERGTTSAGANAGYTYVLYGSNHAGHFSNPFPLSKIY